MSFGRVLLRLLNNYDMMSMKHSIEVRAPFLDHRLVAAVLSKDLDFFTGTENKPMLREILKKVANLDVPKVKIGLRSYIWEILNDEELKKIMQAYNSTINMNSSNSEKLYSREQILNMTPSQEIKLWKNINHSIITGEIS